jgi:bifunctional non-homologous end joining protein LigD
VIPEGYGAGIVMLWDKGTWTPESDDVDAALKKGDLKFTLNGYKLKGSWVLVKTSGRWGGGRGGGDRSWLLIKHKDDWSGEVDIAEFAPRSVKSEGEFEDILAQDNPAIWHTNRPAKGGETGAAFEKIIARAAAIKSARDTKGTKATKGTKEATGTKETSVTKETTGTRKKAATVKKTTTPAARRKTQRARKPQNKR